MLVTNCLFRAGGAAAIMTNYSHPQNKYELLDSERTHAGRDDDAFGCMVRMLLFLVLFCFVSFFLLMCGVLEKRKRKKEKKTH